MKLIEESKTKKIEMENLKAEFELKFQGSEIEEINDDLEFEDFGDNSNPEKENQEVTQGMMEKEANLGKK